MKLVFECRKRKQMLGSDAAVRETHGTPLFICYSSNGLKTTRLAKNPTFHTEEKERLRLTYYTEVLL